MLLFVSSGNGAKGSSFSQGRLITPLLTRNMIKSHFDILFLLLYRFVQPTISLQRGGVLIQTGWICVGTYQNMLLRVQLEIKDQRVHLKNKSIKKLYLNWNKKVNKIYFLMKNEIKKSLLLLFCIFRFF